ncbi:MAG: histidine kinase [Chromatiales bacterium]
MAATALTLTFFFRHTAVDAIVELGESANVALAHSVLNTVRPELIDYLGSVATASDEEIRARPMSETLVGAISAAMAGTKVVRIKIYNQEGMVVLSTNTTQVGQNQANNPGFLSALKGTVKSKLIYRDTFNVFDRETEEQNLIQTYVPVRQSLAQPIVGVFEIYTDVNPLAARTELTEIRVAIAVIVVLTILYGALLLIVRRSDKLLERQQATIAERSRMLELLSSRLLTAEQDERRRIARELHEGIAQTLAAAKFHLDKIRAESAADATDGGSLRSASTAVRQAIEEVRIMAMEIHPSGLDEHGLLATVGGFVRELGSIYPDVHVETKLGVSERQIPAALKGIIYRIIQDALTNVARHGQADRIELSLERRERRLALTIKDSGVPYDAEETVNKQSPQRRTGLESKRERTVISGGEFSVDKNDWGGTTTSASWPC